ncbi:59 protein [uncultured Caudovirales phage]|uniref:59 protein n=1 Tax=uncultured Caudovirales phage TaxID=2100421 RepID=A0A6J5KSB4_9CAUD|nr:59 protein [uncultured Caudovirales phage]
MNGYEAYQAYQAVRLHFMSESFDYFTYHGKSKTSLDAFNLRKDKYLFHKIAKIYDEDELSYFYAINFVKLGKKTWINGMIQDEAVNNFKEWKKNQQARTYNFDEDLKKLAEMEFSELVTCKDGQFPELMNLVFQKEISYDSLIILDHFIKLVDAWNSKLGGDFIWDDFYKKFKKYKPFFINYAPLSEPYYKKMILDNLIIKR